MLNNLRTQFQYNARILLANSYWLLIIPLVASQLVIFWHMAVATLVKPATVAKTYELVIPLLAAFLCAHIVAPEHRNKVDEITWVRPVPFTRTIGLRILALYSILLVLGVVMLSVYKYGLKQDIVLAELLLAGVPSTLFLSMLSIGFASSWRSPSVGIGAALLYWIADAWRGSAFNPVFSLWGYSSWLEAQDDATLTATPWLVSKGVLLVLALLLSWATMSSLRRPASPKRWRSIVRVSAGFTVVAVVYLATGAVWQMQRANEAARADLQHARETYETTFAAYGALPVVYLFGVDFAHYVGYPPGEGTVAKLQKQREETVARLRSLAERWPESKWADNALYEVVRRSSIAQGTTPEDRTNNSTALETCRLFLDRYPTSDFASLVAARMVVLARAMGDEKTMMWAYDRVMKVYGGTEASSEAADELRAYYLERGMVEKAIEAARIAAEAAPPETRADALLSFAEFLVKQGRTDEARGIFSEVEEAVQQKLEALGLAVLTPENMTPASFERRREIVGLRNRARAGLAALDAPAPPPQPQQ